MSDKAKKKETAKQSLSTNLPVTADIEELPETELDYVSGGFGGDAVAAICITSCKLTKSGTQ